MLVTSALGLVALGAAAAVLVATVTRSPLFEPLLERVVDRWPSLDYPLSCSYCASHWASALLVVASRPTTLGLHPAIDLPLAWLAVTALTAPWLKLVNWCHATLQWGEDS